MWRLLQNKTEWIAFYENIIIREDAQLLIIHRDFIDYITPLTYPKQYIYYFIYWKLFRYAMAYPLRNRSDVPGKFVEFITAARNLEVM